MSVTPNDEKAKPDVANIYFSGAVNNKSVSELGVALNHVAVNHPSVKTINLVVNSEGGDAQAGKLGYALVKGSRIPVRAINGGLTASAASFIFCGARDRGAIPGAFFVLHPAFGDGRERMKPDDIQRFGQYVDNANDFGRFVYKQCTTMSDDEITRMNKAEYFAKYIGVSEASDIKLVNTDEENIPEAGVSIFIHDEPEK